MTNPNIRFIRRGQAVTLVNVPPTRTLLEVLREDLGATGTKEGCGEGDCGACTVVLGEAVAGQHAIPRHQRCIRLAHSIDGLALWTVEDLAADPLIGQSAQQRRPRSRLAPRAGGDGAVPRLPVRLLHPGFRDEPVRPVPEPGLPWRARHSRTGPGRPVRQPVPLHRLPADPGRGAIHGSQFPVRRVNEAELLSKLEQLKTIPRWGSANLDLNSVYMTPKNLSELLALRRMHPDAQIVAGCTDVGLWVTKQHRGFAQVLDVTRVAELRQVERYPHHIAIGAAVTLTDAFDALVADRPQLQTFAQRFAGLPVRNSGTLGGNVANGSPIGDSMPLLIALGANVVLMSQRDGRQFSRELPLEQLYTGYRQNLMAPGRGAGLDQGAAAGGRRAEYSAGPPQASERPLGGQRSTRSGKRGGRIHEGLQDLQALRGRHLGRLPGGAVCASTANASLSASIGAGGVAATPVRAAQNRSMLAASDAGGCHFRAGKCRLARRIRADLGHAGLGGLPARGAGQPAAALLARNPGLAQRIP